jgi:hypothetical protein
VPPLSVFRLEALILPAALCASLGVACADDAASDPDASCRIPFETLKDSKTGEVFPLAAAVNENDRLPAHLRQRYVVADLNSTDAGGYCRGVAEYFSPVGALSEFPHLAAIAAARDTDIAALAKESVASLAAAEGEGADAAALALELEDLRNYQAQVQRFKTDPVVKPPVFNGYCVGQTLSFCEIVEGRPKLVYRFVTSSSKWPQQPYRYYAPVNIVQSRNWSSDRPYTPADARRDERMGGGSSRPVPFQNGGHPIEMPNFLHFLPAPGYPGERANGIHQIAGGLDSGGTFGSPVSLGCIRLNKFQAKLARWWTPRQAKFFIYLERDRYRHFGDARTGKAKTALPALDSGGHDDQAARRTASSRPAGLFDWLASVR